MAFGMLPGRSSLSLEERINTIAHIFHDDRTPSFAKILIFGLLVYIVSPIDPIPDFLPVVGYIDEVILVPVIIGIISRWIPEEVKQDAKNKSTDPTIEIGWPKYVVAGIILCVWVIIGYIIIQILFSLPF
ncbi:MAG: YkvA family protein [Halobacteriaceae archaeon]